MSLFQHASGHKTLHLTSGWFVFCSSESEVCVTKVGNAAPANILEYIHSAFDLTKLLGQASPLTAATALVTAIDRRGGKAGIVNRHYPLEASSCSVFEYIFSMPNPGGNFDLGRVNVVASVATKNNEHGFDMLFAGRFAAFQDWAREQSTLNLSSRS